MTAVSSVALLGGCGSTAPSSDASNASEAAGGGGSGGGGGDPALPAGACRIGADCEASEWCAPPGTPSSCGIGATAQDCSTDADCASSGDGPVCAWLGGDACPDFPSACVPGCTGDAACAVGSTCDPSGHCVARSCAGDADCPADFACGGDDQCARKECAGDADCSDGSHCIANELGSTYCFGGFGACQATAG